MIGGFAAHAQGRALDFDGRGELVRRSLGPAWAGDLLDAAASS